MKILKETFELARATALESEVPLWLVGDRDVITEVMLINALSEPGCALANELMLGYSSGAFYDMIPVGMHRYGKVITKYDRYPGPGCNLVEKGGRWCFVDECGDEVVVEIVEPGDDGGKGD